MEIVIENKDMWDLFWAYSGFQVLTGGISVILGYVLFSWVNGKGPFRGR